MATQEEVNRLVTTLQVLKNRDLISICASNQLAKSGNKAELQNRIVKLIDACVHDPNPLKFANIKNSILQVTNGSSPLNYRVPYYANPSISSPSPYNSHSGMSSPFNSNVNGGSNAYSPNGGAGAGVSSGDPSRRGPYSHQGLQFKPSPFYEIDTPLGDVRQCEVMAQHRNSLSIVIRASQYADLLRCTTDPTLRVLIFCAANNYGVQEIAFPYQCEIKVNGGEVKANLRGLKNKPGSTRPVDITDLLRLKPPTYGNSLEFTYALTAKRFYLAIYICKTFSVSTLASRIEKRSRITKSSVIREVAHQAQDPDIVATSLVLSLKCPLTYMRLDLPVRATTCKHIQCFDATSYLQLQEQGPQWLCPICSKPASFDSLAVDEYVKDILENTPRDLEQVSIDPDGTWHSEKAGANSYGGGSSGGSGALSTPQRSQPAGLFDDDLEIVSSPVPFASGGSRRQTAANVNGSANGTANGNAALNSFRDSSQPFLGSGGIGGIGGIGGGSSRDTTATPSGTNGNKRPREVIDLTLSSDDEDDEPVRRPFKRQNIGYGGSSVGSSSMFDGGSLGDLSG